MDREQVIIQKILKQAKKESNDAIEKTSEELNGSLNLATIQASEYVKQEVKAKEAECSVAFENAKKIAMIDKNKIVLAEKNEELNNIFEKVYELLCEIKKKQIKDLYSALLTKYAESEDEIILGQDGKISKSEFEKIPVFVKKKLKICKISNNFTQGFIITNSICDKNFTFENIVSEKKKEVLCSIAKAIFE